jgi:hypothetical protein
MLCYFKKIPKTVAAPGGLPGRGGLDCTLYGGRTCGQGVWVAPQRDQEKNTIQRLHRTSERDAGFVARRM